MAQAVANAQFIVQYGPYGRQEKPTFNFVLDKTDRIKTVNVGSGAIVDGIGFEIVDQSGKSEKVYYGAAGHETGTIHLKDDEYITQISGSEGVYAGTGKRYVAQLFIHTNLDRGGCGPYGRKENCSDLKSFKSPVGSTVGFFGSTDDCLASIGISERKET